MGPELSLGGDIWGNVFLHWPVLHFRMQNLQSACIQVVNKTQIASVLLLFCGPGGRAVLCSVLWPPEEPRPQGLLCVWLVGSQWELSPRGLFVLLMLFTPEENGVISTKSSSLGQAERSGFCTKMLTTSWFYFKQAGVQFAGKNLPEKHSLANPPPELLCWWQTPHRPRSPAAAPGFHRGSETDVKCAIEADFPIIPLRSDF